MTTPISVLILTKDEQRDLPGCLDSVAWSDDTHVLDSGSTDATRSIASSRGVHVVTRVYADTTRPFGGDEAAHRNWGLANIPFKYPWLLLLDADERATPGLMESAVHAISAGEYRAAFEVRRRDIFLGRWLRHVQATPYYLRLVRPERLRYERLINPTSIVDGPIGRLTGFLDHYPFSKGMTHWLQRHNGYSSLEAAQIVAGRRSRANFSVRKAFVARGVHERRFHQKELFYKMPFRPIVRFLLLYLAKRGFLDGRAGLTYAVLQSFYEYMIVLKVRELDGAQESIARAEERC